MRVLIDVLLVLYSAYGTQIYDSRTLENMDIYEFNGMFLVELRLRLQSTFLVNLQLYLKIGSITFKDKTKTV